MPRNFRSLVEEIESITKGQSRASGRPSGDWSQVSLTEDNDDRWTPAASLAMVAMMIEGAVEKMGVSEARAIEYVSGWLDEAYKWSHAIQPDEKDVSDLAGTMEEPPNADVKRGARLGPAGLTPSADEWRAVIIRTLKNKTPKPIAEFPLELAAEMWDEALGKAINKGIGIKWELDKPTGISYPMPDYSTIYGIWKAMIEKAVGVRPSREGEVKLKHALDKAAVEAAKDLRKGAEALGSKRSGQASGILRGRQGAKNPNTND